MARTLGAKIFHASFVTSAILIALIYSVLNLVVAPHFEELDRAAVQQNLARLGAALDGETAELAKLIPDWAEWDDTYRFAAGQLPQYVEDNLGPKTLSDLHLDLLDIYDQDRHLVWSRAADLQAGPRIDLEELTRQPAAPDRMMSGLALTSQGLVLFAAGPILTSKDEGPSHGTLVVGRLLDRGELAAIEQRTVAPIDIQPTTQPLRSLEGQVPGDRAHPAIGIDGKTLEAAYVMRDVTGQPAVIVSTRVGRNAYRLGARAIELAMACLVAATGAAVIIMLSFMNLAVLRPMKRLQAHITEVGRSGELVAFDDEARPDEVGQLAREFNGMMRTLSQVRQREAEQALASRKAMETARAANLAKSRFLAHMSHELRTPLNAIIGFSEIIETELMGPVGTPAYRDYAGDIHLSGQHLLALVDDLLDLSRTETGDLRISEQPMELQPMVAECCRILAQEAQRDGLTLTSAVDARLCINADPRMCRQMVLNLLGNAIKFTPRGGRVTVSAGRDEAGRSWISIADTGVGMTVEQMIVALQAFGQVSRDPMIQSRGVGLGLPLTKRFIEEHGGTLDLHSVPGEGTTATLIFPAKRSLAAEQCGTGCQAEWQ